MDIKTDITYIYNNIANDFSRTRYKIWPCVSHFLSTFEQYSSILDIGCGNGKNMLYPNLKFTGIDISQELVNICNSNNLNVIQGDMTSLPFLDNSFDGFITIASYHHLNNDCDRMKTLKEMYRVIKPNGYGLLTVWAMEQCDQEGLIIDKNISRFHFTKSDEFVKWIDKKSGKTYYRYYHIYSQNQLQNEIQKLCPQFHICSCKWEKGNWCITLQKLII